MLLDQEYPKSKVPLEIFTSSGILGLLVYLFLIVFQPFGTLEFSHPYKYLLLLPYGLIAFFTFSFINFITFKNNKWTIKKELIHIIFALFLFAFIAYWYNILFVSKVRFSFINLLFTFLYAFAIGLPVAAIYVLSRFLYLNKTDQQTNESQKNILKIKTQNKGVGLKILEEDFIFAESADNYCIIYYDLNSEINKSILRISLINLISQIESEKIKRCHRSYIINLDRIDHIKGNAQGYKVSFKNIEHQVSISRNYIQKIIPILSLEE